MIRRLNASCRLKIASAIVLCTLFYGGCVPATYGASNLFEANSYEQLANAEQLFFGKPNTTDSFFKRLDLLEIGIFGRVRSGSAEKRFGRISDALGLAFINYAPVKPPGDLTRGLANHLSRENGALPELSTIPGNSGPLDGLDPRNRSYIPTGKTVDSISELTSNSQVASSQATSSSSTSSISGGNFAATEKNTSVEDKPEQKANSGTTSPVKPKPSAGAKPGRAPILSKETPKLELQGAQKIPVIGEHRIKRPSPGATDIAHDKTREVEELFKKGMSEFRQKRYAEAQICFKNVLAIDPRNVDAYYNLGSLSETRHDYIDALTYYRAALATKPSDSDFKLAVHAMEEELHRQRAHVATAGTSSSHITDVGTSSSHVANVGTTPSHVADVKTTDRPAPEATVGGQQAPILDVGSTDAPDVPVQQIADKTFSLQTAQNGMTTPFTPMNGIPAPYQGVPVYGVPQTLGGNIPSNNNILQNPPNNNTRGTFNSILKLGANAALQGSGLHCPICRVLGGLH